MDMNNSQEHEYVAQEHEYVDLGLPSGTLWATCNVGASKPEDFGDYFEWEEGKTSTWGKGWRMPSEEQWEELKENTKSIWTIMNGVKGRLFTSKTNGKTLFLPAAGYHWDDGFYITDGYGRYWSGSLHTERPYRAWYFHLDSGGYGMYYGSLDYGFTVRPVCSLPQSLILLLDNTDEA